MKKTIAILLVLTIGIVGIFADNPLTSDDVILPESQTVILTTKIVPINKLMVAAVSDNPWAPEAQVSSIHGNYIVYDLDTQTAIQELAYVHAQSNNRGGFKVSVTADLLASGTEQEITYLEYKIFTGSDNDLFLTVSENSSTEVLFDVKHSDMDGGLYYDNEKLSVEVLGADVAFAGVYEADITFSFTAS